MAAQWMEERGLVSAVLGYMIVRDEDGQIVADWDAESHATYDVAAAELERALTQEPLYEWFLAELRPAEVPF